MHEKKTMVDICITCIRKSPGAHADPYAAIESLGWLDEDTGKTGEMTREALWEWLNDGGRAFVRAPAGHVAHVQALTGDDGLRYVQSYADKTPTEHLLHLPEC